MTITFAALGVPQSQGSKIPGVSKNGKRYVRESNKSLPAWRQLVLTAAQEYAPDQLIEGPVAVTLNFFFPVPRSAPKKRRLPAIKTIDVDKAARACLDAMSQVIYVDDKQVVKLEATKDLAYDAPVGVVVRVDEISPSLFDVAPPFDTIAAQASFL